MGRRLEKRMGAPLKAFEPPKADGGEVHRSNYPGEGRLSHNVEIRSEEYTDPDRLSDAEWLQQAKEANRVRVPTKGEEQYLRNTYGPPIPPSELSKFYLQSIKGFDQEDPPIW